MKTLQHHIILYDADCPMCNAYTRLFVKTGMLDKNGRAPYQQTSEHICPYIDKQRAVNEIALIDTKSGEVSYGIKSLFKVIGHSFPVFKGLFNFAPFVWLMAKVYAFISYNRKVIIPTPAKSASGYEMQPTFRLGYRILYLLFTVLLSSLILSHYAMLFTAIIPTGNAWREYIVCGGQVLFQGIIATVTYKQKVWDYLGNMMTISFAASLLLLPVLFITQWIVLPQLIYVLYFLFIAGLMLLEHIRRTHLLKLGWGLSISWVIYRLMVVLVIFKLQ